MKQVAEALFNAGVGAVGIAQSLGNMIAGALLLLLLASQVFKATFSKGTDLGIDIMPLLRGIIILFVLQLYGSLGGMVLNIVKASGEVNVDEGSISMQFKANHEAKLAAAQVKFIGALYEQGKAYFTNMFSSPKPLSYAIYGIDNFSAEKLKQKASLTNAEIKAILLEMERKKNIRQIEQENERILLAKEAAAESGGLVEKISYYFTLIGDKLSTLFSFTAIAVNWLKEGVSILVRNVVVIVASALLGFAFAVGPIPIALSIAPAFKDAWQRWLSSLISFGLWGVTIKVLDTMCMGLAEYTFAKGMDEGNPIQYITINIVMIVMYLATPKLSNLMLGSGGEFYSAMTALAGGMAMSKFSQGASMATGMATRAVGGVAMGAGSVAMGSIGGGLRTMIQSGISQSNQMAGSARNTGASPLAGGILGGIMGGIWGLGSGMVSGAYKALKNMIPKHNF